MPALSNPRCMLKAQKCHYSHNSDTLDLGSLFHQEISEYLKNIISLILTRLSGDSWQVDLSHHSPGKRNNATGRCCVEKGARTTHRGSGFLASIKASWLVSPTIGRTYPEHILHKCVWIMWAVTSLALGEGLQITDMLIMLTDTC